MGTTTSRRARIIQGMLGTALAAGSLALAVGPAGAAGSAARPGNGRPPETVRVEGIVGAVHADPTDDRGQEYYDTMVTDERDPSRSTAVTFPPALAERYGGIDGLTSKRVAVTAVSGRTGRTKSLTAIAVDVQGDATKGLGLGLPATAAATSKPQLTVLCKFADKPVEPQTQSYFQGLTGDNGLMDDYFRTTSYQQINLLGSKVAPATGSWFTLPNAQAEYVDADNKMKYGTLYSHCATQAATQVNLDDFSVINMAFNTNLVGYAFGGQWDGRRVTWLPPMGWHGGVTAHEIGHAFRMSHDGLASAYDNAWDVMSGSSKACTPHATYICLPQHQSGFNKMKAGWLDGRIVDVPLQATTTLDLKPMDNPGTGPVVARISPVDPENKHAYYVEYRRPAGLDANLPFNGAPGAVLIYEYWETPKFETPEPGDVRGHIQLMGTDGKAGARWLPGSVFNREEMFTGNFCDNNNNCVKSPVEQATASEIDGIRIRVNSTSDAKASITVTQLPAVNLKAGPVTPSSFEVHWADPGTSTESYLKLSYTDLKKNSGTVILPANATSYTFQNAPSGVKFQTSIRACNDLGCGPGGTTAYTGASKKPLKIV